VKENIGVIKDIADRRGIEREKKTIKDRALKNISGGLKMRQIESERAECD